MITILISSKFSIHNLMSLSIYFLSTSIFNLLYNGWESIIIRHIMILLWKTWSKTRTSFFDPTKNVINLLVIFFQWLKRLRPSTNSNLLFIHHLIIQSISNIRPLFKLLWYIIILSRSQTFFRLRWLLI